MQLNTDYQLRQVGQLYFLVPLKSSHATTDQILSLNETGAFLWNHLQQILYSHNSIQHKKAATDTPSLSFEELTQMLCDALQTEYDAAKEELLPDIYAFLNTLQKKKILYVSSI